MRNPFKAMTMKEFCSQKNNQQSLEFYDYLTCGVKTQINKIKLPKVNIF